MKRSINDLRLPQGLRRYTPDDLPAMTAIFNETALSGVSSPVVRPLSLEEMTFFVDFYVKEGGPVYVCERAGEVVAWLSVNLFSWGGQACRLTGEISVYVRNDRVGSGLGLRMGRAAMILAERYGFENVVGWVIERNHASRRTALGLGLALWGQFPRIARFGEQRCDVLLYGKALTSHPETEQALTSRLAG